MSQKRSSFSGKLGFILAAAGSAVGLGNIWRFPYLAAEYGGGIFLLTYVVLAFTLGFVLLCTEIAIGRKTGKSVIDAYKVLDKRFTFVGWLGAIVPVIILPYYSVIGGWVTKYFAHYVSGNGSDTAKTFAGNTSFFELFIAEPFEPLLWFAVFIGLTAIIVLLGVEKGIEKVSKVMMPLLVLLTLGIAIYVLTMDGAMDGFVYYVKPDFAKFSFKTVLAAMGQLFYSMSIAMGIMVTYGSYMKKNISISSSARSIAIFDFGIAFLAGLMVIPAVFANGQEPGQGPGLMFATLPKVFEAMPGGHIVGTLFFILVFFAAITSSISLMETVVSVFMDKKGWSRKKSIFAVLGISIILGSLSALGFGPLSNISIAANGKTLTFLDMFDFATNSVIMPIIAFLTCLFVGYILKPKALIKELNIGGKFKGEKFYVVMVKYIAPVCILAILAFSVLEGLGFLQV